MLKKLVILRHQQSKLLFFQLNILLNFVANCNSSQMSAEKKLYSCDFEVFGRVQGVFFRKYTQNKAKELELRGWCMNTRYDTVKGQMEGPLNNVNEMKEWLRTTGSPSSKIDKAEFSELKEIQEYTFKDFSIER